MLLYRPLIWPGPDGAPAPDAGLAAQVAAQPGGSSFRITLKPWRWSDGAPVTAADAVFGWQELRALGDLYPLAGQAGMPDIIADLRQAAPDAIAIMLRAPRAADWMIRNLLPMLYALPRHAWGAPDRDTLWRRQSDPDFFRVTDGPFRLAEFHPDRYAVFTPNPLYGGQAPRLARLVITFQDGANPLQDVRTGGADIARMPYALWPVLRRPPAGFAIEVLPEPHGFAAIALNLKRADTAWLREAALRRALARAIDQRAIIAIVYRGLAGENHTPAPAGDPAWRGAGAALAYDPAAARAAFAEAGWRRGADGYLYRGGAMARLSILSAAAADDAPEMQALQMVQRDWRALGIDVTLRRTGFDRYVEILGGAADGWQAASIYETLAGAPDGSGMFDTEGGNNFGGYADAGMDRSIAAVLAGGDAADFLATAVREQPWIFLPQGEFPVLYNAALGGVDEMQNPLGYWRPENLFIHACH